MLCYLFRLVYSNFDVLIFISGTRKKNSNQFNSIRIRPSVCVCHFDRSDNCSMNDMKIALVYFCTKEHYVQLLIQNSIQYNSVCIDQRC